MPRRVLQPPPLHQLQQRTIRQEDTARLPLPLLLPPLPALPPPLPPQATRPKNTTATGAKAPRANQTRTTRRIAVSVAAEEGLQRSCSVPFYSVCRGVQPGME